MDSALASYSTREKRIAEILAIYDYCDLVKDDPCYNELLRSGYDSAEIRDFASKLNDQEIVTTLTSADGVLAIRMEEQNLRDFLICRHFAKEGNSSFADFVLHTAEMPNAPYLKAAKSMAEVCGSVSVYDYLRRECEKAWNDIKNRDARIADQFIITFNQLLPIQALAFASSRIENAARTDVSEEILGTNSTSDGSMPLHISVSLMNSSEYSQTALELFVECIEKGTEQASQYKWACGPDGAFAYDFDRTGFDLENSKLDALVRKYRESHSRNIAACLITLTDAYLSSRAQHVRQNGITYTYNTLTFNFTSELAELHAHCFRALSVLVETEFGEQIKSTFRQHFSFYGKEPEAEHAEDMHSVLSRIEELFPIYISEDSTIDLSCSLSINQIYETCAQNPPLSLDEFRQSTFDTLGLENSESPVGKKPRVSAEDLPPERLTEALGTLAEDYEISDKKWESGRAIGKVLLEIAKRTPGAASIIIARHIASLPPTIPVPYEALDYLAETIGRKVLRKRVGRGGRRERPSGPV